MVLAATTQMFRVVPKGFIPDQDDDSINIGLRAAQGTAYEEMYENVRRVGNLVRTNPNLQRAVAFLGNGPGGAGAMNTARVVMRMKPRADRVNTAHTLINPIAAQALYERKGIQGVVIPDGFDFDREIIPIDEQVFRSRLEILSGDTSTITRCRNCQAKRGGGPTAFDRVLATRFGGAAVELIQRGVLGKMVANNPPDIVPIPLADVVGRTKTVPLDSDLIKTARAIGVALGD